MITWRDVIHFSVNGNPTPYKRVEKTEEEWRTILTPEQFQISRLHGTERPHTGSLCSIFEGGIYQCICCNTNLFDSTIKFDSSSCFYRIQCIAPLGTYYLIILVM